MQPRLFAAGYDHSSMKESSLIIWDIERGMNQYLNRVRIEEELIILNRYNNYQQQFSPDISIQ